MKCQSVSERVAEALKLRRLFGSPPGYQGFPVDHRWRVPPAPKPCEAPDYYYPSGHPRRADSKHNGDPRIR